MGEFVFDKGESSEAEQAAAERQGDEQAPAEVPVRGDFTGIKGMAVSAMRTVYDPEIPVNIYDLGLIYRIDVSDDEKRIEIAQTLAVELNTPRVRVVILNDASPNFCYDLTRQGEVLFYGAPEILRNFESRVQADFLRGVHGRRESAGPIGAR